MPLEKRDLVRVKCGDECGNYMSRGRDGEDPDSTNVNGLSHNSSLRSGLHFNQVSSKNIRTLPWITGRIPKAYLGEKEQFMEGGLRKQTLTTKNKAFCFCNKMQLEEMGAELAWSFWLILPVYELTTHKAWRLNLACYNRAFRQKQKWPRHALNQLSSPTVLRETSFTKQILVSPGSSKQIFTRKMFVS